MSEPIITKTCSKCKESKALSEFQKNLARKDSKQDYCKICQNVVNKAYRQSLKGKKKINHLARLYRKHNPNRWKAMNAVNHAVRGGKLPPVKTLKCHLCFNLAEQYHHYLSYKPQHWLNILPVCKKCHRKIS